MWTRWKARFPGSALSLSLIAFCAAALGQPPSPPFRGLKEDYARIARLNLGIIRHLGTRLTTGFQREFSEDFNNNAILFLAYQDKPDALNLWEISRAKGIEPAALENTRRYFDYFLLLTAPNGARARFGHDYQRDSVAAVFALGARLLRDGRYKYALNRVAEFSLEKRYRFPLLDLIWNSADDGLAPVEPRRKSAFLATPWTDYTAVGKEMPDKIVFRDGWNPADDAFLFLDLRHSGQHALADAQMLGCYIWRDTPWLINTSERALHTRDVDYRWQANALVIRPGAGAPAADYLKHRESDRASADVQPADVGFQELGAAAFSRSSLAAAGFLQTRAVWHLERGYTVVFDSARAQAPGTYTIGTVWHTAQPVRLKSEDMLLLEDGVENRFSLRWFPGQPIETGLQRRLYNGTPEASSYYGVGKEVSDLFQAGSAEFRAGQRWNITNLLLPHRKMTCSARNLGSPNDSAFAAVEVEQPDSIDVLGVGFEPGLHAYGRIQSNAEAILARWSRKFAGPVRIWYVNGDRLRLETGLPPESIAVRRYAQQSWYVDAVAQPSESALDRKAWSFSDGRVEISLPSGSGEIEIRFAPPARRVINLNRDWKHLPWDSASAARPDLDDSAWRPVQLPYSELAREGENVHWYRKRLALPLDLRDRRVFLEFEGVAIQCAVWVNGRQAGEHLGAFNSFRLDVTPFLNRDGAPDLLAVRVDFSPGWRHKIPFLPEGYNDYGGIYRDVWLAAADPLHLDSVFITTPELNAEAGVVKVQAALANQDARKRSATLVSIVYDAAWREVLRMETPVELAAGAVREFSQTSTPLARPNLWSPQSPYLYTVVSRLVAGSKVLDELRNPLGFRWFRFDPDKGFFLNGRHLKLRGANMHQGYPFVGNALPNSRMPFDLQVLKAMGCNFLRTTHITMDPVVLEMADRLGLLVWEEIPVAGFGNGRMGDPFYDESARQQMREMVRRDRNHPSVILWSTMNEAAGGESRKLLPATLKLCRDLHQIAKQEDPTRLTAIAETVDAFFGITDVSGRNGYFRGRNLYQLGETLDQLKRDHPEGRFLISEYGAPDVERGSFGAGRTDSEEYAAIVHQHNEREYAKRDWIAGSTVWNAFDYFHGAPHEGVADEARYPKDAYFYYQSRWSAEPMLRIRSASHWNYPGKDAGSAIDVVVDTNCDSVELFLNGRSQGTRQGPGPLVWSQLFYAPGTLRAVGRKGSATLEHSRATAAAPYKVVLTADAYELAADGRDLASLQARLVDEDGRLVASSYETLRFAVQGEGDLVGPSSHRLLAGVATLASVRSRTTPGEIRVSARLGRLKPAEILIRSTDRKSSTQYQ